MALFLNRIVSSIYSSLPIRSFGSTFVRMQNALENLENNPYFEKYADRIAAIQKTSPEEFKKRIEEQKNLREEEKKKKFASVDTRQFSAVLNPKEDLKEKVTIEEKKLDAIFKTELVKDKDAAEIRAIWEQYHIEKEVISATVPFDLYKELLEKMKQFPTFLFPLPRLQGYEFIMSQIYGHTVHFTPLLAYQVHKENAPECLTMVHYTEFSEKGIVLMRGEYDKNTLNGQEAQCLANQFQMFYNGKDQAKQKLLETFTKSPDSFKHMDLISQLENLTLS